MNNTEQKLLNVADTVIETVGELITANNPAYAGVIALGTALADHVNETVNPSADTSNNHAHAQNIATLVPAVVTASKSVTGPADVETKVTNAVSLVSIFGSLFGHLFSVFEHKPI